MDSARPHSEPHDVQPLLVGVGVVQGILSGNPATGALVSDERQLADGLTALSLTLAHLLAQATGTTRMQVLEQVRATALDGVSHGVLRG